MKLTGLRDVFTCGLVQQHTASKLVLTPRLALQGYLTKLQLGNLVSAGMLSVNVLFSNDIQVRLNHGHPSLRSTLSTDLCQTTTPCLLASCLIGL